MNAFFKHLFFIFLFVLITFSTTHGQSRKELEKKKNDLVKDIEYKNKLLEETKKNQKQH